MFGIQEEVLLREIQKHIRKNKDEEYKKREREKLRKLAQSDETDRRAALSPNPTATTATSTPEPPRHAIIPVSVSGPEREVIRYVAKFGMCYLLDTDYADGEQRPTTVLEYIRGEIEIDHIAFSVPEYKRIFDVSVGLIAPFYNDLAAYERELSEWGRAECRERLGQLDPTGLSNSDLQKKEVEIQNSVSGQMSQQIDEFREHYLERKLCSHPDDQVREESCDLVAEKHHLSKIYTQNAYVATERDRLLSLVPKSIHNWKNALVAEQISLLKAQIAKSGTTCESAALLQRLQELFRVRSELAKWIGMRVVNPK